MPESTDLGDGTVNWIASTVADGTATPDDARRLLAEFVRQVDAGKVQPRMIEHMRDCVHAFLVGEKNLLPSVGRVGRKIEAQTLDKAFGLTRATRGRSRTDPDVIARVAAEVLEQRLTGASLEQAMLTVVERRKERGLPVSSDTEVRAAWAEQKMDALVLLRLSRLPGISEASAGGWPNAEVKRLAEIYKDELGNAVLVTPENSGNKPA